LFDSYKAPEIKKQNAIQYNVTHFNAGSDCQMCYVKPQESVWCPDFTTSLLNNNIPLKL